MEQESEQEKSDTRRDALERENATLQARLKEAEETLQAIRHGEADALLVSGPDGPQVYTLESAEQPYRILVEQMQEGAVTLSSEGTILYCNMRFAQMLKLPHERLPATSVLRLVLAEQAAEFRCLLQEGEKGRARAEITFCAGDGTLLPTFVTVNVLPAAVEGGLCMIVTDLTEQKSMRRHQAEIQALNLRLQRAMTETHHRVKNSLQIISALVDLQLAEFEGDVPAEKVQQLNLQVRTLATVHDVLTQQSKEDAQVNTLSSQMLLGELIPMLQQIAMPRIVRYEVAEVALYSQQGVSLALIVNELVLNALKHGEGAVDVVFDADDTTATLQVSDDGAGLPEDFDPDMQGSTGIYLVENLATMDLKGTIVYENRPDGQGARIKVTFPLGK